MSRQIKYRIDGEQVVGPYSATQPGVVHGLTNDETSQVEIQIVDDGIESNWSNPVSVKPYFEPPEPPALWHGWWDHRVNKSSRLPSDLVPYTNIGKSMERNISSIVDDGVAVIAQLGKVKETTQAQRKSRLAGLESGYFPSGAYVPIIHFVDEPINHENIDPRDLEDLADYGRSIYGNKYKYAYTINSGELYYPTDRPDSDYPQNFDYVFHQTYPYRNEGGSSFLRSIGNTKSELFASLDLRLQTLRQKIPESKFFIVGQGFYGGKYNEPAADAPLWFMEWCLENTDYVHGLLWWKYFDSKSWTAVENMPAYLEKIKQAHAMIPS